MLKLSNPIVLAIIAFLAISAVWVAGFSGDSEIIQPFEFSHVIHVEDNEFECIDCHSRATDHYRATFPDIEVCQDCHEDALTDTDAEEALLAYTTEGRQIPWERIYQVPDHVYFSHQRHVTLGAIECAVCHGEVNTFNAPPAVPVIPISMESCMKCHEEKGVTNDCLACHR